MPTTRRRAKSLDEQLRAFLAKWKAARGAQIEKWSTRARSYQRNYAKLYPQNARIINADAERRCRDAEHELKMLRELQRRAGL